MVYDEKNHGFNRRLVLPPCLAQHALHRLCPIVRSCIAPRGTPFPDLDPLWHKDCTLLYVSDENKNNTRVYDNIYIYIYIYCIYSLYIYIIIKGSLGGETSVLRTFGMSGKELVKERVSEGKS